MVVSDAAPFQRAVRRVFKAEQRFTAVWPSLGIGVYQRHIAFCGGKHTDGALIREKAHGSAQRSLDGNQLRVGVESAASRFSRSVRVSSNTAARCASASAAFNSSHLFGERLQFSILRFQLRKRLFMYGGRISVALGGQAHKKEGRAKAKMPQGAQRKGGSERGFFFIAASSFENNEKRVIAVPVQ